MVNGPSGVAQSAVNNGPRVTDDVGNENTVGYAAGWGRTLQGQTHRGIAAAGSHLALRLAGR